MTDKALHILELAVVALRMEAESSLGAEGFLAERALVVRRVCLGVFPALRLVCAGHVTNAALQTCAGVPPQVPL